MSSRKIPKLTLGLRMLLAMHAAGLTSGEMAKKLKVSRHSCSGWLHGRHNPNHATLVQWSEITDVDLDWIVNGQIEDDSIGATREQLAQLLVEQLLGGGPERRVRTNAEYELGPLDDDVLVDITREPAVVRHLAPTG